MQRDHSLTTVCPTFRSIVVILWRPPRGFIHAPGGRPLAPGVVGQYIVPLPPRLLLGPSQSSGEEWKDG